MAAAPAAAGVERGGVDDVPLEETGGVELGDSVVEGGAVETKEDEGGADEETARGVSGEEGGGGGEEKVAEDGGGASGMGSVRKDVGKESEDDGGGEYGFLDGLDEDGFLGVDSALPPLPEDGEGENLTQSGADAVVKDVPTLVSTFEAAADAEEVVLGLLSREEVEEAEKEAEMRRLEALEEEAKARGRREAQLVERERVARERAWNVWKGREAEARGRIRAEEKEAEEAESRVRRRYREAEQAMVERLRKQRAAVGTRYGELQHDPHRDNATGEAAAAATRLARGVRALWEEIPVPLQLTLHALRAPKDRLPRGRYAMLCTLWDRLGGKPLRWTRLELGHGAPRLRGLARPAASRPVKHRGRFSDTELDFDGQRLHTLVPPSSRLRPAMCLVLELYRLRSDTNPVDHVVAWGAVPAANADLRPQSGRFRVPMMRGAVDKSIDQYSKLEDALSTSLEAWLCNLYLDLRPLPREELAEDGGVVGEFDVEIEYASRILLLDAPSETKKKAGSGSGSRSGSGSGAGESDPLLQSRVHMSSDGRALVEPSRAEGFVEDEDEEDRLEQGPGIVSGRQARDTVLQGLKRRKAGEDEDEGEEDGMMEEGDGMEEDGVGQNRPLLGNAERNRAKRRSRMREPFSPSTTVRSHRAIALSSPVAGARSLMSPGRANTISQSASRTTASTTTSATSRLSDLSTYQYAVARAESRGLDRGRPLRETMRKIRYLREELFSDLAFGRIGSTDFWLWLLVLLCALYIALHLHYVGQWLFLSWLRVPVYEFEPTGYGMTLKYVGSVLPMEYELGVVILGPLTNAAVFLVLMGIAAAAILILGHFPDVMSRFVAFFGVAACLDPLLIFVVDLASNNYNCQSDAHPACQEDVASRACRCFEGDAFKLYYRFRRDEGSGVIGIFLTVFVFVVLFMLAAFLLYVYLLRLHMDGRMLDVYRRLHAPERSFLVPDDLEMSAEELMGILQAAKGWKGPRGERRRTAVCDYVLTDPLDASFREVTTHVVIYTAGVDNARTLHRHFLRNPDGTIIELFGNAEDYFGSLTGLEEILQGDDDDNTEDQDHGRFFADLPATE